MPALGTHAKPRDGVRCGNFSLLRSVLRSHQLNRGHNRGQLGDSQHLLARKSLLDLSTLDNVRVCNHEAAIDPYVQDRAISYQEFLRPHRLVATTRMLDRQFLSLAQA